MESPLIVQSIQHGFKITIRGYYPGSKWKRERRVWYKLHAVIAIHNFSVLSFSITDDHVHDSKEVRKILEFISDGMKRITGDKGYVSKPILNSFGWNAIILPRKKASSQIRESYAKAKVVRFIRKTSENQWKKSVEYGKRWNVGIYFSGLKRTMEELIKVVKSKYTVQEIALKGQYYNIMRGMTCAY